MKNYLAPISILAFIAAIVSAVAYIADWWTAPDAGIGLGFGLILAVLGLKER